MLLFSRQFPSYQYYDIQTFPVHLTWPHTQHAGLSGCNVESWWQFSQEKFWPKPFPLEWKSMMSKSALVIWEIVTSSDGSNPGETFQIDWYWRLVKYHQIQLDASSGESMCKGGGSNNLSTIESKDVGMLKHFSVSLGQRTFLDVLHFSVQFGHNCIITHHYVPKIFKPRRLTQVKDSKSWRYNGTISSQWRSLLLVQYISNYKTKTRWWQLKFLELFTPKIGEDEPNLTSIFFRWVGSTTNNFTLSPRIMDGSVENGSPKTERKRSKYWRYTQWNHWTLIMGGRVKDFFEKHP